MTKIFFVRNFFFCEKYFHFCTILFFCTRTKFQIQVGKKLDRKMELASLKNVLVSHKINTFFGSDFPSCCLMTWQSSPDELLFETWVKNLFISFAPLRKTIFFKLFRSRLECFFYFFLAYLTCLKDLGGLEWLSTFLVKRG